MLSDIRPRSEPPAPRSLLVVEDDADLRDALAEHLRDAGYRVRVAGNGREAIVALCAGSLPALVLLDLRMPEMDGVEFLRVQASYSRWAHVPVVVVSVACGQVPAEAENVVAVMRKPVDMDALIARVAQHV